MYKNINFLLEENPDTLPQVLLFIGIVLRNFLTHRRETDYFSLDIPYKFDQSYKCIDLSTRG